GRGRDRTVPAGAGGDPGGEGVRPPLAPGPTLVRGGRPARARRLRGDEQRGEPRGRRRLHGERHLRRRASRRRGRHRRRRGLHPRRAVDHAPGRRGRRAGPGPHAGARRRRAHRQRPGRHHDRPSARPGPGVRARRLRARLRPRPGRLLGVTAKQIDVRVPTAAPPAAVYAALRDGSTWLEWANFDAFELEREGESEPEGLGAIRVWRRGRRRFREEIVELVPDRRFSYTLLSGLAIRGYRSDVDIEPDTAG